MEKKVYIVFNLVADSVLEECRVHSSLKRAQEFIDYRVSLGYARDDFKIVIRYLF